MATETVIVRALRAAQKAGMVVESFTVRGDEVIVRARDGRTMTGGEDPATEWIKAHGDPAAQGGS